MRTHKENRIAAIIIAAALVGGCGLTGADDTGAPNVTETRARADAAATARLTAEADAHLTRAAREKAAAEEAEAEAARAAEEAAKVEAERLAAEEAERAEAERAAAEETARAAAVTDITATSMWTTGQVNVRTGPGTEFPKVDSFGAGTEVQVNGRANGFYRLTDGRFVSGHYLSESKPAPKPAATPRSSTGGTSQGSGSASGGSGVAAAVEAEAARFGMTVVWKALNGIAGYWQSDTPRAMFIDPNTGSMKDVNSARTVVRHEAAHKAIFDVCGTASPSITAGRYEHVTDAWTDIYHGGLAYRSYGYNASDADIARQIHAGKCKTDAQAAAAAAEEATAKAADQNSSAKAKAEANARAKAADQAAPGVQLFGLSNAQGIAEGERVTVESVNGGQVTVRTSAGQTVTMPLDGLGA